MRPKTSINRTAGSTIGALARGRAFFKVGVFLATGGARAALFCAAGRDVFPPPWRKPPAARWRKRGTAAGGAKLLGGRLPLANRTSDLVTPPASLATMSTVILALRDARWLSPERAKAWAGPLALLFVLTAGAQTVATHG